MNTFIKTTIIAASAVIFSGFVNAQNYQPAPKFGTQGCMDLNMTTIAPGGGGSRAKAHVQQADGKIVVAGYHYNSTNNSFAANLLRFDPVCGLLDSTFAQDGILIHTFWGRTMLHDIALQSDGKIVGCGMIAPDNSGSQQFAGIFRFNADGSVDNTLDGAGYKTTPLPGGPGTFHSIMLDSLNRISVVGKSGAFGHSHMVAVRYLTDGTLDNSYGIDGMAKIPFSYFPSSGQMAGAMHADGSITIAAQVSIFGDPVTYLGLCKFTPSGVPDGGFNLTGKATFPSIPVSTNSSFKEMDMGILSDNRVVVAYGQGLGGWPDQTANVVAINPDGTIDNSFGTDGVFKYATVGANAGGIYVTQDDKILLFFSENHNNGPAGVLRLLPDGTLDNSFGNNGVMLAPIGTQPDYRHFHDGFMLANGDIVGYGGKNSVGISAMRFTTDTLADAIPLIANDNGTLSIDGVAGATVQWYFNGNPIAGATGFTYVSTQDGDYKVAIQYAGACTFESDTVNVTTVSINGKKLANGFSLYPNPSDGIFTIESTVPNQSATDCVVYDIMGKEIVSGKLKPQGGKIHANINIKTKGIYYLRLKSSDYTEHYKLIVK